MSKLAALSGSTTYRNLLRLLEKWPIDQSKSGRDLGQFLRQIIAYHFSPQSSQPPQRAEIWDSIEASLNRIASDRYKTTFSIGAAAVEDCGATGLSAAECHESMSNEFLKLMKEHDKSTVSKIKEKIVGEKEDN